MKYFVVIVFSLSLVGCGDIEYIQKIQALEAINEKLRNSVNILEKDVGAAKEELSTKQKQIDQLQQKNRDLEKMSEERIRKFWSMYETDS